MSNEIKQFDNTQQMMLDNSAVESYKNIAGMMSKSRVTIPAHLVEKPHDCLAVVMQAAQWRMNPFVVAQKTFVVNGTLGYEAQLVNAVVSSSKAIEGRFHYEYSGDRSDWKPTVNLVQRGNKKVQVPQFNDKACVRVGAIIAGEEHVTWGEWVYPCDQKVFNSPLWITNPKQQAGYLAVKFWSRHYTPDVLLGVYTPDELHDSDNIKDINSAPIQASTEAKAGESIADRLGKFVETDDVSEAELADSDLVEEYKVILNQATTVEKLEAVCVDVVNEDSLNGEQKQSLIDAANDYKLILEQEETA